MGIRGSKCQWYNGFQWLSTSVLQWVSVAQYVSATMAFSGSVCQCYKGCQCLSMPVLQWVSVAQNFSATMAFRDSIFQCYNGLQWLSMSVLQWLSVTQYASATMAVSVSVCQCYKGFPRTFSIWKFTIGYSHIHNIRTYWRTEKWQPAKTMELVIRVCSTNKTTSTQNISTAWNKIPQKKSLQK